MNYTATRSQVEDTFAKIMRKISQRGNANHTTSTALTDTLDDIKQYNISHGMTSTESSTSTSGLAETVLNTTMKAISTIGSGIGIMLHNATLSNESQPGTNYTNGFNTTDHSTESNSDESHFIMPIIVGSIAAVGVISGIVYTGGRYVQRNFQNNIKEKTTHSAHTDVEILPNFVANPTTEIRRLPFGNNHLDVIIRQGNRPRNNRHDTYISAIYEEIDCQHILESKTASDLETDAGGYLMPNKKEEAAYSNTNATWYDFPRGFKPPIVADGSNESAIEMHNMADASSTIEENVPLYTTNKKTVEAAYVDMEQPWRDAGRMDRKACVGAGLSSQLVQDLSSMACADHMAESSIHEPKSYSDGLMPLLAENK